MVQDDKVVLFEQTPIPKAISKLAIPTILSSLVMVLYNLTDTFFVGMLNNPIQNAAVTLAAPVLLAFNAVNNLFGVGTSSMMSRAMGRKDYQTVYHSSAFGFYCALFSGILFSLICLIFYNPLLHLLGANELTMQATSDYLFWTVICGAIPAILNVVLAYLVRSEGASLHASLGTMSGCFLNMILDPIFILPWGLNLGAAGAGLATFISNCFACFYFACLLFRKRGKTYVSVSPKHFTFNKKIAMGIFGVGIPASIQNLLNVTGMTILNNFTAGFGADAVAAMGIVQKINMVPVNIALGFSQGVMPLVSYNYASGNIKRMKKSIILAYKICLSFLFVATLGYFLGARQIMTLFMNNPIIVDYGTQLLRGYCLGLPFLCIDFMAVGVFQAVGMGTYALCFAIMRKIVLEIPLLYLLNGLFPLFGLAYAQPIAELMLAITAFIILTRLFKKLEKNTVKS